MRQAAVIAVTVPWCVTFAGHPARFPSGFAVHTRGFATRPAGPCLPERTTRSPLLLPPPPVPAWQTSAGRQGESPCPLQPPLLGAPTVLPGTQMAGLGLPQTASASKVLLFSYRVISGESPHPRETCRMGTTGGEETKAFHELRVATWQRGGLMAVPGPSSREGLGACSSRSQTGTS